MLCDVTVRSDEMPGLSNIKEMKHGTTEVVISGFSGRFPESDSVAEFRQHLINGYDMVAEIDRRCKPG